MRPRPLHRSCNDPDRRRRPDAPVATILAAAILAGCASLSTNDSRADQTAAESPAASAEPAPNQTPTTEPSASPVETSTTTSSTLPERPDWLGTIDLTPPDAQPGEVAIGLETPADLRDRRFAPPDGAHPDPAPDAGFVATSEPLAGEQLEASTWEEGCPVEPADLAYLTLTYWGFDDRAHIGDMIVHATVADDVIWVFEQLFVARFPIEEMRVITDEDLTAIPSGDGNVTASFVCREVRGSSRFSEHASGLAVDINPFLNPYRRGEIVLPELSAFYLDRSLHRPGQIQPGDVVVTSFAEIGWGWGGDWNSLLDYQHFALHDR